MVIKSNLLQVTGCPIMLPALPSQNHSMMALNGGPRYEPLSNTPPLAPGGSRSHNGSEVCCTFSTLNVS